jgi:hypothetical protein
MTQFKKNIIVTSATMNNPDPTIFDGVPVDPKFPSGVLYCPIGITVTKEPEK